MIRYEDLRSRDVAGVRAAVERLAAEGAGGGVPAGDTGGTGVALTAWQAAALSADDRLQSRIPAAVTVPDFLHYARLLNTGQALPMIGLAGGVARAALAGLTASPALLSSPLRAARTDFWLVAEVLLRYDLALLPAAFRGPVLLHSYLADFAFLFERRDFVTGFFAQVGEERAGVSTQQLPLALSSLARWGVRPAWCSFLLSPGDRDGQDALQSARASEVFAGCRFIGEVESLPRDLQTPGYLPESASSLAGLLVAPPE